MTRAEAGTSGTSATLLRSSQLPASDVPLTVPAPASREAALSCHPSASAQKSLTVASGRTREPARAAAQDSPWWVMPMNCMEGLSGLFRGVWSPGGVWKSVLLRLAAEEIDGGRGCLFRCSAAAVRSGPHVVSVLQQEELDVVARPFQRLGQACGL